MDQEFNPLDEFVEQEEAVEQPQEQPVRMVQVRFNGDTYEMPESLADAWHKREELFNSKIGQMGARVSAAERQGPATAQAPVRNDKVDEIEFLSDPMPILRQREEALQSEIEARLERKAAVNDARRQWWSEFYTANPALRNDRDAVEFVFNRSLSEIGELPLDQAQRELAQRAKKFLRLEDKSEKTEKKTLHQGPVTSERASNPRPTPAEKPPTAETGSISHAIKARAEARRRAQYKLKEEK